MNVRAIATLVVAFACITSVGVASTTLESSLSSNPDEVVNVEHDRIPLSPSDTNTLKSAVTGGGDESGDASAEAAADGSMTKQKQVDHGSEQRHQQRDDGSSGQQQKETQKQEQASDSSSQGDQPRQSVGGMLGDIPGGEKNWLALLVVVLLLALLVYYRDRVAALLEPPEEDRESERVGVPAPKNDVERAWVSILGATRLENPWQKTPAECADAAVESGLDPDAVGRIRRVFEEVTYGEREVTEARRDEVRRSLAHLDVRADLRTDGGEPSEAKRTSSDHRADGGEEER